MSFRIENYGCFFYKNIYTKIPFLNIIKFISIKFIVTK